jgi:hypothetical protein
MNNAHVQSRIRDFQEVTMSVLERTEVYQKADHKHPAFRPSGVMNSDVSEVTETNEEHPLGATLSVGTPIAKQVVGGVLILFTLIAFITLAMHSVNL